MFVLYFSFNFYVAMQRERQAMCAYTAFLTKVLLFFKSYSLEMHNGIFTEEMVIFLEEVRHR